ncbi:MAG TPA: dehydrogenase [Desulfobulbaceae bacterium]|nr:dehydrogenase [Desulfobulbaceae bacterium]
MRGRGRIITGKNQCLDLHSAGPDKNYHRQTVHTYESVRSGRGVDWNLQPKVFKRYPSEFAEISLTGLPSLRAFLHHCCGLTKKKTYPGGSYFLRANPSAGALYPCEVYLQARGISGIVDAIYQYEPFSEKLRLLHPLGPREGLEGYWHRDGKVEGLVLLVTAIYYRSSWKYGHRALRYCLLDSGHLLGGIEAAACCREQNYSFVTRFNRNRMQKDFGFKGRELPMAMGVCGKEKRGQVVCPDIDLPFINGSGSFCRDPVIEEGFAQAAVPANCRKGVGESPYSVQSEILVDAILSRRSIRKFTGQLTLHREYEAVLHTAMTSLAIDCDEPLDIFALVNRVKGMEPGLYKNNRCLRSGNFSNRGGYLCLEQDLGADSAVTFFLVGDSKNYLPLMLKAGLVGQRIYLSSELQRLGCSGIGAFYDREVADFLETDGLVLYALAIGR